MRSLHRYGLHDSLELSFGLINGPSRFQRLMNTVLGDRLDKFALVYLDDILVFSKTAEGHKQPAHQVLIHSHRPKLYASVA